MSEAIIARGLERRLRFRARPRRVRPRGARGGDPRPRRAERRREDDVHPRGGGTPHPGVRHDRGARADPRTRDRPGHGVHDAGRGALRGPLPPREPPLLRTHLRPREGGRSGPHGGAARVGGPRRRRRPSRAPPLGWAAPAREPDLRDGARAPPPAARRADRGHRPDAPAHALGALRGVARTRHHDRGHDPRDGRGGPLRPRGVRGRRTRDGHRVARRPCGRRATVRSRTPTSRSATRRRADRERRAYRRARRADRARVPQGSAEHGADRDRAPRRDGPDRLPDL